LNSIENSSTALAIYIVFQVRLSDTKSEKKCIFLTFCSAPFKKYLGQGRDSGRGRRIWESRSPFIWRFAGDVRLDGWFCCRILMWTLGGEKSERLESQYLNRIGLD
jgi:hypothetical protein